MTAFSITLAVVLLLDSVMPRRSHSCTQLAICIISSPEHHHSMIALSIKIYLNNTFTFVNMY